MTRLEDLKPNCSIRGVLPGGIVTVVSVQWFGSDAIELTYKDATGKVGNELLYLLKPEELPANWDPANDPRLTAWEVVHHLIRALGTGGERAAADLVAKLGVRAETARELAYHLYTICERKKRAAEALSYNGLVQSWPEIARLAREERRQAPLQPAML